VQEKQNIHQCRKNKISTSAGKTNYTPVQGKNCQSVQEKAEKQTIYQRKKKNYPPVQEKRTIRQCRKNKLSTSAGKTNYPPVQEKQATVSTRAKNTIILYKKHFKLSIIAK
jgi:hypothetical protein